MRLRVADGHGREDQACRSERDPEVERLRSKSVARRNEARRQRGARDRDVARKFIQPHRQATPRRAGEIDFHDHRRRPAEALAESEQRIGRQHPGPARRPHQHERHRHGGEPPGNEDLLPAEPIREAAREIVGARLAHAEDDDERQHRRSRAKAEFGLGHRRQDAALHPDHRADEGVDQHQERKLRSVLAQAEADHARPWLKARIRSCSLGLAGTSMSASMNWSRGSESMRFQRFSNAMVLEGLPLIPTPQPEPRKCPG